MAIYKEDIVAVELQNGTIHRSFLGNTIGSGDKMANRFGVSLLRNGEPVSAESSTVTGLFIAPDGTKYAISETNWPGSTGKEGSKAWVQLPEICYAVPGVFSLAIKLSGGSVEGTMRIVDGMVCETGEAGAVVPTSTIPTTAEIIAAYEEAVEVVGGSVRFDASQTLSDSEQETARENIKAISDNELKQMPAVLAVLQYPDTFTAEAGESNACIIKFTGSIYLRGKINTGITFANLLTALGQETAMTIAHNYGLTYNIDTQTWAIKQISVPVNVLTSDVIVFFVTYGRISGGIGAGFTPYVELLEAEENIAKRAYNGVFYIGNNGDASWTEPGVSNVRLNLGENDYIYRANGEQYTIQIADIIAAAEESSIVQVDENNIISGNTYAILFDTETETVKIVSGTNAATVSTNPIIFYAHYGSVRAGLLVDYMTRKRIENITNTDSADIVIPEYYQTNIETARASITENMMEAGQNGETFIFITDTHWESNRKHSPSLVKYLLKNLNINLLLCGGDLINQGERATMIERMREAITAFSPYNNIVMPCAFGNHDSNWNNWDGQREHPERRFDMNDQYALMQKQAENLVTYITEDKWNFFFDVRNTRTRFIVIDTGEDGTFNDYSDLADCMMDTPAGFHIVIMGHWLYNNGNISTACTNVMNMIDAYNARTSVTVSSESYNFGNAGGTVELLLGGHAHKDVSWTTQNGVPVVLTDCDAGSRSQNTDYPYVAGTVTEQAFDVFTINYDAGTVKAVRVGRGEDRTWSRD